MGKTAGVFNVCILRGLPGGRRRSIECFREMVPPSLRGPRAAVSWSGQRAIPGPKVKMCFSRGESVLRNAERYAIMLAERL